MQNRCFDRTMQKLTKSARTFAHLKRPQIMAGGRTSGKTVTPDTNSYAECSECVMCWYSGAELEYMDSFVVRSLL